MGEQDEKDNLIDILTRGEDETSSVAKDFQCVLLCLRNEEAAEAVTRLACQAMEKCCQRNVSFCPTGIESLIAQLDSTIRSIRISAAQSIKQISSFLDSESSSVISVRGMLAGISDSVLEDSLISRHIQKAKECFEEKPKECFEEKEVQQIVQPSADNLVPHDNADTSRCIVTEESNNAEENPVADDQEVDPVGWGNGELNNPVVETSITGRAGRVLPKHLIPFHLAGTSFLLVCNLPKTMTSSDMHQLVLEAAAEAPSSNKDSETTTTAEPAFVPSLKSNDITIPASKHEDAHAYLNCPRAREARHIRQCLDGRLYSGRTLSVQYVPGKPTRNIWIGKTGKLTGKNIHDFMSKFGYIEKIDVRARAETNDFGALVIFGSLKDASNAIGRVGGNAVIAGVKVRIGFSSFSQEKSATALPVTARTEQNTSNDRLQGGGDNWGQSRDNNRRPMPNDIYSNNRDNFQRNSHGDRGRQDFNTPYVSQFHNAGFVPAQGQKRSRSPPPGTRGQDNYAGNRGGVLSSEGGGGSSGLGSRDMRLVIVSRVVERDIAALMDIGFRAKIKFLMSKGIVGLIFLRHDSATIAIGAINRRLRAVHCKLASVEEERNYNWEDRNGQGWSNSNNKRSRFSNNADQNMRQFPNQEEQQQQQPYDENANEPQDANNQYYQGQYDTTNGVEYAAEATEGVVEYAVNDGPQPYYEQEGAQTEYAPAAESDAQQYTDYSTGEEQNPQTEVVEYTEANTGALTGEEEYAVDYDEYVYEEDGKVEGSEADVQYVDDQSAVYQQEGVVETVEGDNGNGEYSNYDQRSYNQRGNFDVNNQGSYQHRNNNRNFDRNGQNSGYNNNNRRNDQQGNRYPSGPGQFNSRGGGSGGNYNNNANNYNSGNRNQGYQRNDQRMNNQSGYNQNQNYGNNGGGGYKGGNFGGNNGGNFNRYNNGNGNNRNYQNNR